MAKQIRQLLILDEATSFILEDDNDNLKIILNEASFNIFISSDFNVKQVIILVELEWNGHTLQEFYGYEVAKKLMISTLPDNAFDIRFISTIDRDTLLNLYKSPNRIFIRKFPHVNLSDFNPKKINTAEISTRKFNYLKNYCLVKTGIIDRLAHDLKNLLGNLESGKLSKFVSDIKINSAILTEGIIALADNLLIEQNEENKRKLLSQMEGMFSGIREEDEAENGKIKKSKNRVILIEDDKNTLDKLETQLRNYFKNITSFNNGSDAYKILADKKKAYNYDVVITDMELLDGEFDDPVQGIDILELCEEKYPFLVTRIVTAMPKNALRQLTGKNLDEIIFKNINSDNVIPLLGKPAEFVDIIDKEVEKKRKLRTKQRPHLNRWSAITPALFILKEDNPKAYDSIWKNAINKADKFINGQLNNTKEEDKISLEFGATSKANNKASFDLEGNDEDKNFIELLLTHRLIALWFFKVKSKGKVFYFYGSDGNGYADQLGFQRNVEGNALAYFTSYLGLSGNKLPRSKEGDQKCQLLFKDLFPKEVEWLSNFKVDFSSDLLTSIFPDVLDFIVAFEEMYRKEVSNEILNNYTVSDAITYFTDLARDYKKEQIGDNKHEKLKNLISEQIEYFYNESLPPALKNLIDKIKENIFN